MKPLALALSLLLALPVWAQASLDALRSTAKGAREQAQQVRSEQMLRRTELSQLSGRIEALKAQRKRGSTLDAALKESQALSDVLTQLARTLASKEAELESTNLALLDALSQRLAALRSDFDHQPDRAGREKVVAQMKALRQEREQVRAALPATKVPALPTLSDAQDPEDLLAQADLLQDQQDKVKGQLAKLDKRIAELKAERELDRRNRDFQFEDSALDESDRRFNVRRESNTLSGGSTVTTKGDSNEQTRGNATPAPQQTGAPAAPSFSEGTAMDPGAHTPTDSTKNGNAPLPGVGSQNTGNTFDYRTPGSGSQRAVSATDARPLPVVNGQRAAAVAGGDDDDLEDLEVQRRRLQGLSQELQKRAADLKKRAAQLE